MNFNLSEALEILERTPETLEKLLVGLSPSWLQSNEGDGTWNTLEVIEHLIVGEKEDWIPRIEAILLTDKDNHFKPFDRFAHLTKPMRDIEESLKEFKKLRTENIRKLKELVNSETNIKQTGIHPEFGEVTLEQLLSTWVVHDLTHISQIVRVMANRYKIDVGPWKAYLGILNR
jgi:hypothetical protein